MTSTFERLCATLIKDYELTPDQLVLDATLEDLGIDSLGTAELMFNIEDEFEVTMPLHVVQLTSLADVIAFIDALIVTQRKSTVQTGPVANIE